MVDSYHQYVNNLSYDDLYNYPTHLKHLHTAYPIGRKVPSITDDMTVYEDFVKMVKALNYNGMISVEGSLNSTSPEDITAEIKASLKTLKSLFE